ncbi:MAG: hypothetical protein QM682_05590 [Paracoccus sp. (in: a-proteobacteria)]|uniref:hypothetical protein n=1 Tax=Paracoccus sp. TaxID=267 RepID=UPI0039E46927
MEQGQDMNGGVIKELGMFGLKSLLTLNAGSCLALLAFLANILAAEKTTAKIDLVTLRLSLIYFIAGIGLVLLAVVVTYIQAQLAFVGKAGPQRLWAFLSLMIAPSFLSFVAFACGAWTAIAAVNW